MTSSIARNGGLMSNGNEYKLHKPIDTNLLEFKGVVIDGSNIIQTRKDKNLIFCVSRLYRLMDIVKGLGWKTMVGVQAGTLRKMTSKKFNSLYDDDRNNLQRYIDSGEINIIYDEEDDYHLISVALNGPYYLLSNDKYKDWKKSNPTLRKSIDKCLKGVQFLGDDPSVSLPSNGESTVIVRDNSNPENSGLLVQKSTGKGALIPFERNIGRTWLSQKFDLLKKDYISSQHFRFRIMNDKLMLEDLSSTNGTYVDGLRLPPNHPMPLEKGVEFRIGPDDVFALK